MMRVYVDTNIFMDFIEERFHLNFFERSLKCEVEIVISDVVIRELKYQKIDSMSLISWLTFAKKIQIIRVKPEDSSAARQFKTHFNDALHIVLAEKKCDALLTRNTKDFFEAKIPVLHPDSI